MVQHVVEMTLVLRNPVGSGPEVVRRRRGRPAARGVGCWGHRGPLRRRGRTRRLRPAWLTAWRKYDRLGLCPTIARPRCEPQEVVWCGAA